jgi:hypothetical protein
MRQTDGNDDVCARKVVAGSLRSSSTDPVQGYVPAFSRSDPPGGGAGYGASRKAVLKATNIILS